MRRLFALRRGGITPALGLLGKNLRQVFLATLFAICPASAQELQVNEVCGNTAGEQVNEAEIVFPRERSGLGQAYEVYKKVYSYRVYRKSSPDKYIVTGLRDQCVLELTSSKKSANISIDFDLIHMGDSDLEQRENAFRLFKEINSHCRSDMDEFIENWNEKTGWRKISLKDVEEIELNTEGDICYWLTELGAASLGFELSGQKYSLDIVDGVYFFGESNSEEWK